MAGLASCVVALTVDSRDLYGDGSTSGVAISTPLLPHGVAATRCLVQWAWWHPLDDGRFPASCFIEGVLLRPLPAVASILLGLSRSKVQGVAPPDRGLLIKMLQILGI